MKTIFSKRNIFILGFSLILFGAPTTAHAVVYDIVGTLSNTVFHKSRGNLMGRTMSRYYLDTTKTNIYDSDSGSLQAYFNVYNRRGTRLIGTVQAIGSLPGANFNNLTGDVIGTLDWNFTLPTRSYLRRYLAAYLDNNPDNEFTISATYLDHLYFGGIGTGMNSYLNDVMRLWGADGYDGDGGFDTDVSVLGIDTELVFQERPPVPEPATMALFGSGLFGLAFRRRKK